jgi:hypothetical protein
MALFFKYAASMLWLNKGKEIRELKRKWAECGGFSSYTLIQLERSRTLRSKPSSAALEKAHVRRKPRVMVKK